MVPSPSEMATISVERYILPLRILTGQLKKVLLESNFYRDIEFFSIISRNRAHS